MAYLPLIEALKSLPEGNEKRILTIYAMTYQNLARCPFGPANNGNTHDWTIEDELPASTPRNLYSDFTADYGNDLPFSQTVKLYGGKIQMDEFITDTMPGTVQNQKIKQIKAKAKRTAIDMFEATGGTYAMGIEGYRAKDVWSGQVVSVAGAMTETKLDQGLDKVTRIPGSTFFFTTQSQARAIKKLARDSNQTLNYTGDEFGMWSGTYDGVPIIPLFDGKGRDLFTTGAQKLYLVTFGDEMFHGAQNGDLAATSQKADNWDYFRIKHYMTYIAESPRCFCVFTGVTD